MGQLVEGCAMAWMVPWVDLTLRDLFQWAIRPLEAPSRRSDPKAPPGRHKNSGSHHHNIIIIASEHQAAPTNMPQARPRPDHTHYHRAQSAYGVTLTTFVDS